MKRFARNYLSIILFVLGLSWSIVYDRGGQFSGLGYQILKVLHPNPGSLIGGSNATAVTSLIFHIPAFILGYKNRDKNLAKLGMVLSALVILLIVGGLLYNLYYDIFIR